MTFTARGNRKPWMTTEVRSLTAEDAAFRAGDMTALHSARSALSEGIKAAKGTNAEKIQGHLSDTGNNRRMWQGVQALTDYKFRQGVNDDDASLPSSLSNFLARFEAPNLTTRGRAVPSPPSIGPALTINAADTCRALTRVNPQNNIPGRVLTTCAGELADVLTDIFNISLSQAIIPRFFKTSTMIPVAKKSVVSCLNDYRPIALTPMVMKCFEQLVKPHTTTTISVCLLCQPLHRGCNIHHFALSHHPSGPERQLSAQHSIPSSPRN